MKWKSIVLVRNRERGDVLLCSAIARQLKYDNPSTKIFFKTDYPQIFENNPRIDRAAVNFDLNSDELGTSCAVFNLNLVMYEQMPGWHLIDGFAQGAGFERFQCPRTTEMFPHQRHYDSMDKWMTKVSGPYVVMAPGPGTWEGRNWPGDRWAELSRILMQSGHKVVLVGTDTSYGIPCTMDLRTRTAHFGELAAVIHKAKTFIGIDSFPMHIAGAMKTPRVCLFGVTSPEFLLCDAPNTVAVTSDPKHPFTGLRHKVNTMTKIKINRTEDNPMRTITVDMVLKAFNDLQVKLLNSSLKP